MFDHAESRVRGIVAEHLGVNPEELGTEVSLTDDLAADSLDLLEVALALESEFGVVISEASIDQVRTFGDLLDTVQESTRGRRDEEARARTSEPLVWARVVSARGPNADVQRAGWLTPYTAQTIAEDALRAGQGARLEVAVPWSLSDAGFARVQDTFAWLGRRAVHVSVRRDHHLGPVGHGTRPHAAA